MSEEDQIVAVGRVTTQYAETRKKLAAIFSEIDRHADILQRALWYLKPQQYSNTDVRSGGKSPDFSNFPTGEQLNSLVEDTLATLARKKDLHAQLKEFGAEPKD
jgi:hypothetical protein